MTQPTLPLCNKLPEAQEDFRALTTAGLAALRDEIPSDRVVREKQLIQFSFNGIRDKTITKAIGGVTRARDQGLLPPGTVVGETGIAVARLMADDGDQKIFIRTKCNTEGKPFFLRLRGGIGQTMPTTAPIDLVSGICLFGRAGISLLSRDPQTSTESALCPVDPETQLTAPLGELMVPSRLSAYELESVIRLTALIREIAAPRGTTERPIRSISIQVPKEEYFCYLIPALYAGNISRDTFENYCAAVTARGEILSCLLKSELGVPFTVAQPLSALGALLRNPPATAEAFMQSIGSAIAQQGTLRELFERRELIAPRRGSSEETDLAQMSRLLCVMSYLSGYLGTTPAQQAEPRRVFAVENPSEEQILVSLETVLKKDKALASRTGAQFDACYVAEQVIAVEETAMIPTRVIPSYGMFRGGGAIAMPPQILSESLPRGPVLYRTPNLMNASLRAELRKLYQGKE